MVSAAPGVREPWEGPGTRSLGNRLGGTEDAGRHIGYLTKYLVKSIGEVVTQDTEARCQHADRLHAELAVTPCSPRCAVWLLYGIQPLGVTSRTVPGQCKGRAHRRSTLGLPGRRVLVSRKWSGKTLADHRADRMAFVAQALAAVGIDKPAPDTSRLTWRKSRPVTRTCHHERTCSYMPSPNASDGGPTTTGRC
jgi:hypothetical protein